MSKLKKTSGLIGCLVASVLAVVAGTDHDLKTSPDGLAFISNLEGCSSSAYQCSADRWTAGLGHTKGVKQGDKATTETIADWYIEDISAAEKVVNRQAINGTLNRHYFSDERFLPRDLDCETVSIVSILALV